VRWVASSAAPVQAGVAQASSPASSPGVPPGVRISPDRRHSPPIPEPPTSKLHNSKFKIHNSPPAAPFYILHSPFYISLPPFTAGCRPFPLSARPAGGEGRGEVGFLQTFPSAPPPSSRDFSPVRDDIVVEPRPITLSSSVRSGLFVAPDPHTSKAPLGAAYSVLEQRGRRKLVAAVGRPPQTPHIVFREGPEKLHSPLLPGIGVQGPWNGKVMGAEIGTGRIGREKAQKPQK